MKFLIKPGELPPIIYGMSYNSANGELFFADNENRVVRAIRLHDNSCGLIDVLRGPVYSVCYVRDSDTVLVCSYKQSKRWLMALSRNGNKWRKKYRLLIKAPGKYDTFCRALRDSRVLCGEWSSNYMELFRVEDGPRIARLYRFNIAEHYTYFDVTCNNDDTLVAMSYKLGNSVRVCRLRGHKLEEIASSSLQSPCHFMWVADRILATEWHERNQSNSVTELEMNGTRLKRRSLFISSNHRIDVWRWCAKDDGPVIFDYNSKAILHYSL